MMNSLGYSHSGSPSPSLVLIIIILVAVVMGLALDVNGKQVHPNSGICSMAVTIHGYKCQEYHVTTDDGYILSVQRIPEGRSGGGNGKQRPPVLLQHGLLLDGMTWVLNSPKESLGMILADSGFDVWISNTRGTRFSRSHLHLQPSDDVSTYLTNFEYWDWTWDDLMIHDLPAVVNLVFQQTSQKTHYVGHSLGTLIALTSFSQGKLINKITSAALLCPVAYLSHMKSALAVVAARFFVNEIIKTLGVSEFNPKGTAETNFLKGLCAVPGINCFDLLTELTGPNCCLNASIFEVFLENELQPTATKNLVHLAQMVRSGILSKYDYGNPNINLEHYGEFTPPLYDLSNISHSFPLFLSYGGLDALSDVEDVAKLLDKLKLHDVDKLQVQYIEHYAHLDFIMGITAKDILYNQIVAFFRKHL